MKRLFAGLLVLGLLTGCSSMKVQMDYLDTADFSQFKTFKYVDSDMNVSQANQLVHGRIVEAIRRETALAGLTEVETDPDVHVTYYASTSQDIVLTTSSMGYNWGPNPHWHGSTMAHSTTTASTITTGTIIIDIWDAAENDLVWRGEVSDTLSSSPGQNADRINRAVAEVMSRFPPR